MHVRPQRMTVNALLARYEQGELDFPGAHIDQANLRHVRLDSVNLCGARLAGADARGIQLSGAYLSFINFFGADLEAANLCESDLGYADLRCAHLMGADLLVTNLHGAALEGTSLQRARLVAVVRDRGPTRGVSIGVSIAGGARVRHARRLGKGPCGKGPCRNGKSARPTYRLKGEPAWRRLLQLMI